MNRATRNAHKSRSHRRFGSLGSLATQTPTGHSLRLMELGLLREGRRKEIPLYRNGQWITQKLRFKEDETVTVRYKVLGDGGAYLSGVYSGQKHQLLFIRPIRAGEGIIEFDVPVYDMRGFHIILSRTIPSDYATDFLSEAELQHLQSFPMSISNERPVLFSPSFGSLGFVPYSEPRKGASGKTETGKDYWDGHRGSHRWKKHGYTGRGSSHSGVGPTYAHYPTADHAFRSSFYVYEEIGGKKGWNAIEKMNTTVGAGVPIAFVGQLVKHDGGKFFPNWKYVTTSVPKEKVMLIKEMYAKTEYKKSTKKARSVHKKKSVIKTKLNPGPYFKYKLDKSLDIPSSDPDGSYSNKDIRRLAVKVEWWDQNKKKWVYGRHPPHSLDLDKYGTFVAYFRFVRQLASNDPDLKHWNGWALSKTSRAYPNKDGSYTVIGRPYKDGKIAKLEINGDTLYGHPSYKQIMGTMIRGKTNSVFYTQHQTISVTDKEKEVYAKNPNITNVFWKEGEFRPGAKMIIIGQALTTYRRNSMFALTTKQSEVAFDVHEALYFLKRAGLKPGIKHHDLLKLVNIITTEDLIDDTDLKFGSVNVERNVKNAWKEVFGSELSAQWFRDIATGVVDKNGNTLPGLTGADPKNPLNYTIQEGGQTFSYPFSIAVVEIPSNWVGPIVDFDDAGKLTEKSLRETTPLYVVSRNSFNFDIQQKLNITEEIKQQREALEGGKTATETLLTAGQIPDKAVDVGQQAFRERHQIPQEQAQEAAKAKDSSSILDFLNPFGKPYQTDSLIRKTTGLPVGSKVPLGGLGGMNRNNHTLTDVSGKYASDRMTSLGGAQTKRQKGPKSGLTEFYMINPPNDLSGPSLDWLGSAPVRPTTPKRRVVEAPQFGSTYNNSNLARKKGRVMTEPRFRDGRRRI